MDWLRGLDSEILFGLLILLMLLAAWIGLRIRRAWMNFKMRRRFSRGDRGEEWAEYELKRNGYELIDRQCTAESYMQVNGEWHTNYIRMDFLAERDGLRFGVEVKSGPEATKPTIAATRRQLLEYFVVYQLDGLLLANYEERTLNTIYFEI